MTLCKGGGEVLLRVRADYMVPAARPMGAALGSPLARATKRGGRKACQAGGGARARVFQDRAVHKWGPSQRTAESCLLLAAPYGLPRPRLASGRTPFSATLQIAQRCLFPLPPLPRQPAGS